MRHQRTCLPVTWALADRSLALSDLQGVAPEPRYRLLETVRQYAVERLAQVGETRPIRVRHRDWYLSLAERAVPELTGPDQRVWYRRLRSDRRRVDRSNFCRCGGGIKAPVG